MFEKLKTWLTKMTPIEYGIVNLTAMLTVPATMTIMKALLGT